MVSQEIYPERFDGDSTSTKEASLRLLIQEKPQNAKARAQLASLLAERARTNQDKELLEEALRWCQEAIDVQPLKPFGYVALSMISLDPKERRQALTKAAGLCQKEPQVYLLPWIGLLVRLLVEPREEERSAIRGKVGGASLEHPSRRPLNEEESEYYNKLELAFQETLMQQDTMNSYNREFLAEIHYKLGIFFRKIHPTNIGIKRSKYHFRQCITVPATRHSEMASFWIATLNDDCSAEDDKDDDDARHNREAITKCPTDYIVSLYSSFAARFDELLVEKLDYQTPTKLRQLLDATGMSRDTKVARCVDLGCGTGLSGLAFRSLAQHMTGIDLSPEMIEKARQRRCYDNLIVGDVATTVFSNTLTTFDLVVACDVFCYFGDLLPVFQAVSRSLQSSLGVFCFSTEYLPEADLSPYRLRSCARFAHSERYIRSLAETTGFECVGFEISHLRKNEGKPVIGMLVVLKKV